MPGSLLDIGGSGVCNYSSELKASKRSITHYGDKGSLPRCCEIKRNKLNSCDLKWRVSNTGIDFCVSSVEKLGKLRLFLICLVFFRIITSLKLQGKIRIGLTAFNITLNFLPIESYLLIKLAPALLRRLLTKGSEGVGT